MRIGFSLVANKIHKDTVFYVQLNFMRLRITLITLKATLIAYITKHSL